MKDGDGRKMAGGRKDIIGGRGKRDGGKEGRKE